MIDRDALIHRKNRANQPNFGIISSTKNGAGAVLQAPSGMASRRRRSIGVGTLSIPLTQGKFAIIDEADWDLVRPYSWCVTTGKRSGHYVTAALPIGDRESSPHIKLHRLIMNAAPDQFVDHRNGDSLDNRRENLRLCSRAQNAWNAARRKDNISGYIGVSFRPRDNKWQARIQVAGKRITIGHYSDPVQAALARDDAARTHFGEFAVLNFPRDGERGAGDGV